VTGFPTPVVTWRKLTGVFTSNRAKYDKGSLTLIATERNDTGIYECKAKNVLGKATAITSVFVWSPPKFITKPPSEVAEHIGGDLSLDCLATGQASISWRRVGGAWEKERMKIQNGTLKISELKPTDSGSYVCEAKVLFYSIESTTVLRVTCEYETIFVSPESNSTKE